MTNALRTLVSQNRVRFVDEAARLNLDLAYITDRVIAMGYPAQAQSVEVLFRNSASDVKRMLDANHPGCYKVAIGGVFFAVRSERQNTLGASLNVSYCGRLLISSHYATLLFAL